MATLESRNGWYRIVVRIAGKKFSRSLKTKDETASARCLAKIKDNLHRIELGALTIPESCQDPFEILLGPKKSVSTAQLSPKVATPSTIGHAWEEFKIRIPENSLEKTTLDGMEIHVRHLVRLIGVKRKLHEIEKPVLQQYVDDRSKEPGQNSQKLSPETIKKELRTFSTIWAWMAEAKLVSHSFPNHRLRFPKRSEKQPFQTLEQIEAKVERGGLTESQQSELWDTLFLNVKQVDDVVDHVLEHGNDKMIYTMICVAAYSGARRSEILRSEVEDVDFRSGMLTIREKKRLRGIWSTRTVPLQPKLRNALKTWIVSLPSQAGLLFPRSPIGEPANEPVSRDQAHDFFKRVFAKGRWANLKGWHTFRHSFCSNCAAAGIEQRIIDEWVGHQTKEMVRRYRHLFPNKQHEAIGKLSSN